MEKIVMIFGITIIISLLNMIDTEQNERVSNKRKRKYNYRFGF
jgi:hypothetical protein